MIPQILSLKRKFESLLIISSSIEEANRRSGWFIHKCKNAKLAGYFWVKESWDQLHKEIVRAYARFGTEYWKAAVDSFGDDKEHLASMVNNVQALILKDKIRTLRPRFLY